MNNIRLCSIFMCLLGLSAVQVQAEESQHLSFEPSSKKMVELLIKTKSEETTCAKAETEKTEANLAQGKAPEAVATVRSAEENAARERWLYNLYHYKWPTMKYNYRLLRKQATETRNQLLRERKLWAAATVAAGVVGGVLGRLTK